MTSTQSGPIQQSSTLQKQAIENAISAYSSLPHQSAVFQSINQAQTISEVVEAISQRHWFYKRKRFTRLLEKFQQHSLWLQNISAVVDVAVQINTGIGCSLWTPIKFVLLVSNDHSRAAEEIFKMIQTISDDIPRFEIYQRLQSDPVLQAPLLNIFTDVVKFSIQASQYFARRTIVRLAKLVICPFKEEFGDILNQLHRHAEVVDRTAVATELQRASEFRREMAIKERLELKGRCEGWLQPSNIRAIHQYQRHSRLEGTCRWIWTSPKFVKWHEQFSSQASESDRLLCIYGPHGCGKSALASFIAEELERKPVPVLFYSFSGMDTDRQNIDGLIRTFLWQLLQDSSENTRLEVVQNLMLKGPPATSELWEALKKVLSFIQEDVYCIIDGIDECGDSTIALLEYICDLLRTHMKFRATLLGRPRGLQTVKTTSLAIEVNAEVVKQDIEKFINVKLGESKVLRAPDLRDAVFETLQTKSDGMFLWVKLMIDDLSRSATRFDIRERLRNLPRGLEKAYQLLLLRLIERLDRFDLQLARRILAFTAVSCRTLDLEEVRYACALDSQSSSTNATLHEHLLLLPEQSILDVCGDFISITDGLVRLVHFSAKEFFTRPESEWLSNDDLGISCFRIDVENSHRKLASSCVRYLSMGDYGSPLNDATAYERVTSHHPFLKYASMYMISHFSHSGRPCPTTLIELRNFLQSQSCASWIEYVGMILLESGSMDMLPEGFDRFVLWLGEAGGYEVELMSNEFGMFLNQELAKRVREFGEHDPRTEQWQSFTYIFSPDAYDSPAVQQSHSNSNNPAVLELSHLPPSTTLQGLVQIFDGLDDHSMLPLRRQADILLRLQSHLLKVKILTDPLKLLFRIILQKASSIHLYGLLAIADFYQRVDKLDEALEVYNAALSKVESQEVSNKVAILGLIGNILNQQQKYEEAEAVIRRALKEGEMVYGREHKRTLTVAYRLAWILYEQDKFAEAEDLYRWALVRREKVLGAEHVDTLNSVNNLACALYMQHKFAEAEDLLRRALVGREKVLGAEHANTLTSVNNLALALYEQVKFVEAEDLHRRAMVRREKVLGAEHAHTLNSVNNLALALYEQDKFVEAEDLHRRALVGRKKVLGAEHANTLNSVNSLARALYMQDKFVEAEKLLRGSWNTERGNLAESIEIF